MNKKLLSLMAIFGGIGAAVAQPTLNSTDEAAVGVNINYYVGDTTGFNMMQSNNGASVTWDWSALMINATINQRTGTVNDATGDATFAPLGATQHFVIQDYLNMYYNFNTTVKHSQGFRYTTAGTELAIVEFDTASYNAMEYPFDYTDLINNTISGSTTLNLQGNIFTAPTTTGTGVTKYDAYGTLLLPDTTFNNVARIQQRDSVHAPFGGLIGDVDFVVDRYDYYDLANLDIPVFIVSRVKIYTSGVLPQFDPIVSIYSAVPLNPNTAGVSELSKIENSIKVYPNPATDNFTLKFQAINSSVNEITLVDVSGKTVRIIADGFVQGTNVFNVNTSALTKGVYFVKLTGDQGTITKKIIVQ